MFGFNEPINPDALLDRTQTASALTAQGFRISAGTLATLASRGGGPEFERFGALALHKWGDTLTWARE